MTNILVVGQGYVGLPLTLLLAKKYSVTGYDINEQLISDLSSGFDSSGEVDQDYLKSSSANFTTNPALIADSQIIIVAVPTPVDKNNVPDLSILKKATASVGKYLSAGSTVVFESTVYPGTTRNVCVPILQQESNLIFGEDFFVGYSPERVNPGDKKRTIDKIVKIVSGSDKKTADLLKEIYGSVVDAGIHLAPTLEVAEAAKIVENVQRDVNIALVNELAILFDKLGIDTKSVIDAASTKWNFHRYTPGLVGGHCISVDPFYLAYQAQTVGYYPQIIHASRRINDGMHSFFVQKVVDGLNDHEMAVKNSRILILGLTFKENCSDTRNSRVFFLIQELLEMGAVIDGVDPYLSSNVIESFGAKPKDLAVIDLESYDVVVVAAPHDEFESLDFSLAEVLVDVKGRFSH